MRLPWIFALAAIIALPASAWGMFQRLLSPVSGLARPSLVVVKPGTGVAAIARQLEAKHLIRSDVAFIGWLRLSGDDRAIKAGVYAIAPNMGSRRVADVLVEGKGLTERVTVPEGFSLRQIAGVLEALKAGSGTRFLMATRDAAPYRAEFPWLAGLPAGTGLEGFCFPDTYVITPGEGTESDLVRLMLARFEEVALPAWQAARGRTGLDLLQSVTMASIVEKEARHPDERPTIAGVFFNRLKTGMAFGSDPTVEYALNRHQGARGLSLRDVAIDSPYNTYVHAGLPPGPIANPGLASLEAALAPAQTGFLYFVARGDGTHAFTRTYAEHLATQRRLLSGAR